MTSVSHRLSIPLFLALSIVALDGCKKKTADMGDAAADAAAEAAAPEADDTSDASADAAPATTALAQPAGPPSPFAEGQNWSGNYTCTSTGTMTLIIHAGGTHVTAVNSFKKDGQSGQFKMSGTYQAATRHLHLAAGDWISRPGTWVPVDLDGKVSADGKTYSGSVIGPSGCSTFSVHR
jgi:hypothetical protein